MLIEQSRSPKPYNRQKLILSLTSAVLSAAFLIVLLATGLSSAARDVAIRVSPNPYGALLIYAAVIGLTETLLFLPLSFYRGYILEHRYELSNQTLGRWAIESGKGMLVGIALFTPLLVVFYGLLRQFGDGWWLPVGAVIFGLSVLLAQIAPVLLLPIFYKLTPLDDPALDASLRRLAERVGLRIEGLYQIDMSKNTKKANAALAGIGKTRRILLGDTLLAQCSQEEIEVVFAHELGHHQYHHIRTLILTGAVTTFAGLYLTSVGYRALLPRLGLDRLDDPAALPLLALLLMVFGLVTTPLQNALSRHYERQADGYALQTTGNRTAFIGAMTRLAETNLADPEPHPLIEALFYSHPSIGKRIRMAEGIGG
ncbi:MAG: M48 family metallopeptidase [Candidatus Latescibacteria bacterium]|nr:M48 family metallopeptidase [Candidatus Latescibacterota bacterium]